MSDVDRYVGLPAGTSRRWIDGYVRGGRTYPPVIRERSTGDDTVAWGEFVETSLLARFRHRGVSLQRLRATVQVLRDKFETPYPLATSAPYLQVAGREVVWEVQESDGVDNSLRLIVVRNGQLVLSAPAQQFAERAVFDDSTGFVSRMRTEPDTPDVLIDPLRQTGRPVVRSVPTDVLAEGFRAGETVDGLADLYELPRGQVEQAIRHEMRSVELRLVS